MSRLQRTSSSSTEKTRIEENQRTALIDQDAERRLVRKLDFTLLPLFTLAYCTNFIDRTAIGNAKIAGLEKDLGMKGYDYNIALTVFYLFYIAVDIPSNLALKHFGSRWMAGLITSFGLVTIGTAFVKSYKGLLVTRVFLGLSEGGTLSGLTYLLSRYYRRKELVLRIGIFFGVSPALAGAFGGLLASGLLSVPDIGSLHRWQKIFLVEGVITTGFGLLCFFIFPADIQHTRLLTEEERAIAIERLNDDQPGLTGGKRERTNIKLVKRAFLNLHTFICTICYIMVNISFQGLSLFLPTVISGLGHYTVVQSQLRTVPPYVVGGIWAVFGCYTSYRTRNKGFILALSTAMMVAGYAIAIGTKESHARYAACFLSVTGASLTGPMYLAWGTDNAAPDTIRAVTTAIIPGFGALGSVIAVWTYLPEDAPNYHNGNSLNLATSSAAFLLSISAYLYLRWENSRRDLGQRDWRLQGRSEKEIEELGYLHPSFRYLT